MTCEQKLEASKQKMYGEINAGRNAVKASQELDEVLNYITYRVLELAEKGTSYHEAIQMIMKEGYNEQRG